VEFLNQRQDKHGQKYQMQDEGDQETHGSLDEEE
jgi:hypothetical protein